MSPQPLISANSKRVARNTILLYIRMLVMMLVGLYTSRVILNALGQDDFGTYGAVGGVVAMFSILTGAIAGAISRFLTFELGKKTDSRLNAVFSTSVAVQLGMSLLVLVIAEIVGVWFLNAKMSIPDGRLAAANWVLQCSVFAFLTNMLSAPYNAAIIAHEKMDAFAYISLAEAFMTLGVAFITRYTASDKLIVYSVLMLAVALIVRLMYGVYAGRNFPECRFRPRLVDGRIVKEVASYAGWTFIGNGFFVLNSHGINILMNLFFGVQVNAARDVAYKFENAVNKFINNFMTALTPQITKAYAADSKGSKYSFFLVYFFALPIILEAPKLMELWLVNVPAYAVVFVRISMISLLFMSAGDSYLKAINASGQVARYQKIVLLAAVWVFPLTYLAYKSGMQPQISYVIVTIVNMAVVTARVLLTHKLVGLPLKKVWTDVAARILLVALAASVLPVVLFLCQPASLARTLEVLAASMVSMALASYFFGTTAGERAAVNGIIKKVFRR